MAATTRGVTQPGRRPWTCLGTGVHPERAAGRRGRRAGAAIRTAEPGATRAQRPGYHDRRHERGQRPSHCFPVMKRLDPSLMPPQ